MGGKSSSESPAFPAQSKLQPSPLSISHKDSPHLSNSISPGSRSAPITNGSKTKDSPKAPTGNPRTSSPSLSCPPAPKRRKVSSSPEGVSSYQPREDHVKPVISPIHFGIDRLISAPIRMGSEDSNSGASLDGSSPRENGVVPKQYRGDFSKHRSRSKHHGHRHHHDNTAAASKSRHERRHHHPREAEGAGRNSRRDHRHSSKRRRTELDRYR